jgi:hypothetical protein
MRARIRRFMWSPYAPAIITEKIAGLFGIAVAAVTVWLCFGGPVFILYAHVIVFCGRAVGTA